MPVSGQASDASYARLHIQEFPGNTATPERWKRQPQAFTTVLLPHLPMADPEKLAATITAIQDSADATVLKVTDGETDRLIVLNTAGTRVTAGPMVTDAEAALLTLVNGKPAHLSAWHATTAVLGQKKLLASHEAQDLDYLVK